MRISTAAAFVLVVAGASSARAEDAVVARLERSTVTVGEQALLLLDVFGECAVDPEPVLPELEGIELRVIAGPEFSVRSGTAQGGGQEYIASYRVGVVPRRPGSFAIVGIGVVCQSDHRIEANRVDLLAVADSEAPPAIFRLTPSAEVVWARQPFRVAFELWLDARVSNALTANDARFLLPWWGEVVARVEGTSLEPGGRAQKRYEIDRANRSIHLDFGDRPREVDGLAYDVLTGELEILVPEAGVLSFEGSSFRCRLQGGTETAVAGDPAGVVHEAVAEAKPVTVREVPREGRPPGYGTAVGRFTLDVEVDRAAARVGDPVVVTLSIRARGDAATNLPLAEFPGLDRAEGFRRFDHHTWFEDGVRRVRLDLMPESTAVSAVPPFTIHWFDPRSATYESASTDPVPLSVTEHPERSTLVDERPDAGRTPAFRVWPYGVALVFLGLLAWIARRAGKTREPETAQDVEASRRRRDALARLAAAPPSRDPLDESKALARYLADRFDAEPGRCHGEGAAAVLEQAGLPTPLVARVTAWFAAKERAAFGRTGEAGGPTALELAREIERAGG